MATKNKRTVLKRIVQITGISFLGMIVLVMLLLIGLPSFLINRKIDQGDFQALEEVQKIISANKYKLHGSRYGGGMLADGYGYIGTARQVDELFDQFTPAERNKIRRLIESKTVMRIDVSRPKCIAFKVRSSTDNYLINRSWETLWLIYNEGCDCACENRPDGEDSATTESLGNGWYKVIVAERRRLPTC